MLASTIPTIAAPGNVDVEIGGARRPPHEHLRASRRREWDAAVIPRTAEEISAWRPTETEAAMERSHAARGRRHAVVRVSAKRIVSIFDGAFLARDRSTSAKGGESEALR